MITGKQLKNMLLAGLILISTRSWAIDDSSYITYQDGKGRFALVAAGKATPLFVSTADFYGVVRAARDLQNDIYQVTGSKPLLDTLHIPTVKQAVLIGTLGKSPLIDKLVLQKKLDASGLSGKWETFIIQTVIHPMPGVEKALVIAGSDKRGTIYGLYDLSARIGVSPWYWWADVPVKKHSALYVLPGKHTLGEPAVKYRGIFINDEAPALSGWAKEKFGGFNHKFYAKVFELILRLKGNYLWPAMWGSAFNDDDPLNPKVADEYGIVMGTSHHEPMVRAHDEWRRYGSGKWNYAENEKNLQEFWRQGIRRMNGYENIVTIGMRGDGDEPMTEGTATALLERIVKDQRQILKEETGKEPSAIPQLWALYKEVQDYYDKGMRVPDDVTLLLCDDNWGNIRKLPKSGDRPRAGGYGIYYHFDYVGDPRNYKWLNTNPITKVWEQMHLAYRYKATTIWLVNVGDIKPMEFPTEFFLDYAWSPEKWPAERLEDYTRLWARREFGNSYTNEIAAIVSAYTKYNGRRKPELLSPDTYSLINYREAETVVNDYKALEQKALTIYRQLPAAYRDAFYQLVLHPVEACANLNELYVTVAKNRLYAKQGRAETNDLAAKARQLYNKDSLITRYYNTALASGKWNHMMDQTHIGYTYWQQPPYNTMPQVTEITVPAVADMGISLEGSEDTWPQSQHKPVLPMLNRYDTSSRRITLFNKGSIPFNFSVTAGKSWLLVSPASGKVDKTQQISISVNWEKMPAGKFTVPITITGPENKQVIVYAVADNRPVTLAKNEFLAANGYVSIEAAHFTKAITAKGIFWKILPGYGRTCAGITPFPVTASKQLPQTGSPCLEYRFFVPDSTSATEVQAYISPSIDFTASGGLHYAISIDDEKPRVINIHADNSEEAWKQSVADNIKILKSVHNRLKPGRHVLRYWMVDPGVVLQKIVINLGDLKPSYLGPPESVSGK
ncbi:glycosyl hydrolase (plasmid) [Pedobacter sp. BS3]|nr:glycosyl hydrolase [Pedobacter sp. BS3]